MMKTKYIALILIASCTLYCAQSDNNKNSNHINTGDANISELEESDFMNQDIVPSEVKENFKKKYPGENDPDWQRDDKGNWEANFKIDGIKYRADYNNDGSWIETETSIDKDDLPKRIKKIIKEQFKSEEITEVELVNHFSKGKFYDVEFKRKGKNLDIEFRENGEIINR